MAETPDLARPTLACVCSQSARHGLTLRSVVALYFRALVGTKQEPFLPWDDPFPRVLPLTGMKKSSVSKSRRRSQGLLGRKTFVYLTDYERDLVDEAAGLERRS